MPGFTGMPGYPGVPGRDGRDGRDGFLRSDERKGDAGSKGM